MTLSNILLVCALAMFTVSAVKFRSVTAIGLAFWVASLLVGKL